MHTVSCFDPLRCKTVQQNAQDPNYEKDMTAQTSMIFYTIHINIINYFYLKPNCLGGGAVWERIRMSRWWGYLGEDPDAATESATPILIVFHRNNGSALLGFRDVTMDGQQTDDGRTDRRRQ